MVLLPVFPRRSSRKRADGEVLVIEVGLGILEEGMVDCLVERWKGRGELSCDTDTGYDWILEEGIWGDLDASEAVSRCGVLGTSYLYSLVAVSLIALLVQYRPFRNRQNQPNRK